MKGKGFDEPEIVKGNANYRDALGFDSKFATIDVEYQKDNSISIVYGTYSANLNNEFFESELTQKRFYSKTESVKLNSGKMMEKKTWTKTGFKYYFCTAVLEKVALLGCRINFN